MNEVLDMKSVVCNHPEGCDKPVFTKAGLCRGHNLAAGRAKHKAAGVDAKVAVKDEMDVKLDHFAYTKSEHDLDVWENDQSISPLHVPADIKTKYPGMRWHWVSDAKLKRVGIGYQGWQIFKDGRYPEGLKRGNDLMLAAMPEERAVRYNEKVREESNARMIQTQEQDIQNREAGAAAQLKRMGHEVETTGTGISLDRSAIRRPIRGLHPEEVKERAAKAREQRAKGRVFFT